MKVIFILLSFFILMALFIRRYSAKTRAIMLLVIVSLVAYSTFF
uniref:Uncharacterized protein n=1 Tax=Thermogemmatispora argillosa TaxID=2045280 RepID=A0A455T8E5_9CHLR|nr:hypothetical protein KTA_39330 [Thermogemmatispora argillosa]